MLKRLLHILIILFTTTVSSQLSKTHYVPPITSGIGNAIPNDQYIYISTPSDGRLIFQLKEQMELNYNRDKFQILYLILIQLIQMDIQNLFKMLQQQGK